MALALKDNVKTSWFYALPKRSFNPVVHLWKSQIKNEENLW